MTKTRVAIIGSTGSIGTQALDVIAKNQDQFEVKALAAYSSAVVLQAQARRFAPDIAVLVAPPAGFTPDSGHTQCATRFAPCRTWTRCW